MWLKCEQYSVEIRLLRQSTSRDLLYCKQYNYMLYSHRCYTFLRKNPIYSNMNLVADISIVLFFPITNCVKIVMQAYAELSTTYSRTVCQSVWKLTNYFKLKTQGVFNNTFLKPQEFKEALALTMALFWKTTLVISQLAASMNFLWPQA